MREIVDQVVNPGLLTERSLSKDRTFNMEEGDQLNIPTDLHKLTVGSAGARPRTTWTLMPPIYLCVTLITTET